MPREPSRREIAFAALAYLGLTLWWLWPLPLHLATHSLLPSTTRKVDADYYLVAWALAWGAHALVHAPWDVFHANSFYPSTLSLAYSEHFLGQQPLFAPTYWVTGNLVLAVNVFILVVSVASATAMFALARRFTSAPGAFLAGILFAFCPWRRSSVAYVYLLAAQYLPLAVLFAERWFRDARPRDGVLLAIVLTLHMLSSVYLAFMMVLMLAVYAPAAFWRWRRRLDRRRLLGFLAANLVAAVAMGLLSLPYLHLIRLGIIPSFAADSRPPPIGIMAATNMLDDYLFRTGVGPVGYALAFVGVAPPWRGRRWPVLLGTLLVIVGVLVASGPMLRIGRVSIPTGFRWLVAVLPGFGTLRVVARFALLAHTGLALLAALGVTRLLTLAPARARWPLAGCLAFGVVSTWGPMGPLRLEAQPIGAAAPPVYQWLDEHGAGRAVLELPPRGFNDEARRMFLGTVHWLPTVGGYSGYPPRTAAYVDGLADGLPGEAALQAIVDTVDVGWIVVHVDELPAARAWQRQLPRGLAVAARFPDTLVFEVSLPGDPARRARFLSDRETLDGEPLIPLGDHCPGHLELVGSMPATIVEGATVTIAVALHNDGTRAWPGLGFVPRHLVELTRCIHTRDEAPCWFDPLSLPADVRPGNPVRVDVPVTAPLAVGPGRLSIELVQRGDGPLSRCGVAPLVLPVDVVPHVRAAGPGGQAVSGRPP